jgi:hypothetical protein
MQFVSVALLEQLAHQQLGLAVWRAGQLDDVGERWLALVDGCSEPAEGSEPPAQGPLGTASGPQRETAASGSRRQSLR